MIYFLKGRVYIRGVKMCDTKLDLVNIGMWAYSNFRTCIEIYLRCFRVFIDLCQGK